MNADTFRATSIKYNQPSSHPELLLLNCCISCHIVLVVVIPSHYEGSVLLVAGYLYTSVCRYRGLPSSSQLQVFLLMNLDCGLSMVYFSSHTFDSHHPLEITLAVNKGVKQAMKETNPWSGCLYKCKTHSNPYLRRISVGNPSWKDWSSRCTSLYTDWTHPYYLVPIDTEDEYFMFNWLLYTVFNSYLHLKCGIWESGSPTATDFMK